VACGGVGVAVGTAVDDGATPVGTGVGGTVGSGRGVAVAVATAVWVGVAMATLVAVGEEFAAPDVGIANGVGPVVCTGGVWGVVGAGACAGALTSVPAGAGEHATNSITMVPNRLRRKLRIPL